MMNLLKNLLTETNLPKVLILSTAFIAIIVEINNPFNFASATFWNFGLFILSLIVGACILVKTKFSNSKLNFYFEKFYILYLFGICMFFLSGVICSLSPYQNRFFVLLIYLIFDTIITHLSKNSFITSNNKKLFPAGLFLIWFGGVIGANIFWELKLVFIGQIFVMFIVTLTVTSVSVFLLNEITIKMIEMENKRKRSN